MGLVVVLATARGADATEASWTDDETAGATFTAGRIDAPVANDCAFTGTSFTARWTPPAPPSVPPSGYQYRVLFTGTLVTPPTVVQGWTTVGSGARQFTYAPEPTLIRLGTYTWELRSIDAAWDSPVISGTVPTLVLLVLPVMIGCSWS